MSSSLTPQQIVDQAIKDEYFVLFGKSWCPYCKKARELISILPLPEGKELKDFNMDLMPEGEEMQAYLKTLTGQSSVPNIFVQGKHVGGNDNLQEAHKNGKLVKMMVVA